MIYSLRKKLAVSLLLSSAVSLLMPVQAQDYFDEIIKEGERVYELDLQGKDSEEGQQAESKVSLTEFDVSFAYTSVASAFPKEATASLTPVQSIMQDMEVQRGTILKLENTYYVPPGNLYRRVKLHSKRSNPDEGVTDDMRSAHGKSNHFADEWESSKKSSFKASADMRKAMKLKRTPNDFGQIVGEAEMFIHTGNLLPGDYQVEMVIFRKEDGKQVDTSRRTFDFEVTERPIKIKALIPNEVKATDKSDWVANDSYPILISDWAVPPLRLQLFTSYEGVRFEQGGTRIENASHYSEALTLNFEEKQADHEAEFSLVVTDATGRIFRTKHSVWVEGKQKSSARSDNDALLTVDLWYDDEDGSNSSSNSELISVETVEVDEDVYESELIDVQTIEVDEPSSGRSSSSSKKKLCASWLASDGSWIVSTGRDVSIPGVKEIYKSRHSNDVGVHEEQRYNADCKLIYSVDFGVTNGEVYYVKEYYPTGGVKNLKTYGE